MFNRGQQLGVRAARGADCLEGLGELGPLPVVSERRVEVRGGEAEEPPVLVRGAGVRRLAVLQVGEHRLGAIIKIRYYIFPLTKYKVRS